MDACSMTQPIICLCKRFEGFWLGKGEVYLLKSTVYFYVCISGERGT